jgi:hypothetical protein
MTGEGTPTPGGDAVTAMLDLRGFSVRDVLGLNGGPVSSALDHCLHRIEAAAANGNDVVAGHSNALTEFPHGEP